MVLQVRRPETVQGHQDEGGPGETGRGGGRREEGKELSGLFFFLAILLFAVNIISRWKKEGGLEKLFITSSNPFRTRGSFTK